ncbi:signal transduction histidine kinase [Haloactinopolyspora alba]|uniref:histidine kinase n=1 Tax=Haloactinopolyspora alba TaxID=648780 RepID=A0A2P8DJ08_9ACTN|nr:signal transduction histidine kinase [Haloactinopolyspora alba]
MPRSITPRAVWSAVWPALVILIPGIMGTGPAGADQPHVARMPDAGAYLLVVAAAASVLPQLRRPEWTVVGVGAAVTTYLAVGYPFGPVLVSVPIAAFGITWLRPLRRAQLWAAGLWILVFAAGSVRFVDMGAVGDGFPWLGWIGASVSLVAVPAAIGAATRIRRESAAGVRAAQARRAVSEERLRMAQELHDSVGHGLAVIAMQSGVALHVLDRNPDRAREALEAIRDTSTESLNDLRAELDALRTPEGEQAPRRPAPGLGDAGVLLERVRAGGVDVDADLDDVQAGELSPAADVALYRILQEALTNVLRHSGATRARVRVHRDGDVVVLEVRDNGRGTAAGTGSGRHVPTGSGIPGMRARAEELGGSVSAGQQPDGGFAVRASLPVSAASVPGSPV